MLKTLNEAAVPLIEAKGAVALNSQKENDSIPKKVLGHFCFRGIIKLQETLQESRLIVSCSLQ